MPHMMMALNPIHEHDRLLACKPWEIRGKCRPWEMSGKIQQLRGLVKPFRIRLLSLFQLHPLPCQQDLSQLCQLLRCVAEVEDRGIEGKVKRGPLFLCWPLRIPRTETKQKKEDRWQEIEKKKWKLQGRRTRIRKLEETKEKAEAETGWNESGWRQTSHCCKCRSGKGTGSSETSRKMKRLVEMPQVQQDPKSEGMKKPASIDEEASMLHGSNFKRPAASSHDWLQKGQFLLRSWTQKDEAWWMFEVSPRGWLYSKLLGAKRISSMTFRFSAEVKKFTSVCYLVRSSLCFLWAAPWAAAIESCIMESLWVQEYNTLPLKCISVYT